MTKWLWNMTMLGHMLQNRWNLTRKHLKMGLVWFGLICFEGISTIVGYLMPFIFYTCIEYVWFWFGWVLWHINHCRLFNANSLTSGQPQKTCHFSDVEFKCCQKGGQRWTILSVTCLKLIFENKALLFMTNQW